MDKNLLHKHTNVFCHGYNSAQSLHVYEDIRKKIDQVLRAVWFSNYAAHRSRGTSDTAFLPKELLHTAQAHIVIIIIIGPSAGTFDRMCDACMCVFAV